jgi:hypothetical protein
VLVCVCFCVCYSPLLAFFCFFSFFSFFLQVQNPNSFFFFLVREVVRAQGHTTTHTHTHNDSLSPLSKK